MDEKQMITEYELYSDERYCNIPGVRYLCIGGLICTSRRREHLNAGLQLVRERSGLGGEIKWGRISSHHFDSYQDYMRVFFKDRYARFCLLSVNCSDQPWTSFVPRPGRAVQRDDRLASVFHQFLLVTFGPLHDTKRWTVYHDAGFFSQDRTLKNVEFLFNRTYKRAFGPKTSRIIRFADSLDSRATDLIQLADLLLGAETCRALDVPLTSPARRKMLESYQAMLSETPQTATGFPKIQVAAWVPPDRFDYKSTCRKTSP